MDHITTITITVAAPEYLIEGRGLLEELRDLLSDYSGCNIEVTVVRYPLGDL